MGMWPKQADVLSERLIQKSTRRAACGAAAAAASTHAWLTAWHRTVLVHASWREGSRFSARDCELLDAHDGAGWDLMQVGRCMHNGQRVLSGRNKNTGRGIA
eukprot:352677-Chlamydomonas_euryale.AAC.3